MFCMLVWRARTFSLTITWGLLLTQTTFAERKQKSADSSAWTAITTAHHLQPNTVCKTQFTFRISTFARGCDDGTQCQYILNWQMMCIVWNLILILNCRLFCSKFPVPIYTFSDCILLANVALFDFFTSHLNSVEAPQKPIVDRTIYISNHSRRETPNSIHINVQSELYATHQSLFI